MTGYNILSSGDAENDYPLFFPETNLDLINSRSIPPGYSYTRNSSGTYVGSDGLIKTAAVNEPRFDHNPATGESLGLLVEEARTNLLTYSEQFDNAAWSKVSTTVAVNAATAPDGTTTADKIIVNNTITIADIRRAGLATNGVVSFYAKPAGFDFIGGEAHVSVGYPSFRVNLVTGQCQSNSGALAISTQNVGNGWWRVAVTGNFGNNAFLIAPRNDYVYGYTGIAGADGVKGIFLWGAQLEAGAFPTSYIPTTGSTVTRQPDQLVLNRTLNPQGAFYIESNTLGTSLVADNGSSTISPPQGTKSALFYNTSRTLSMSSSTQPVEGNYDVPQNLNRVSLGFDRLNNLNYINGHLKKFMYYGSPVTEDNLRSLTGNTRPTFRFVDRESIVTDGLVLNLDAGNPVSYPGSGTTWTDLSGNGNNGTLVNGVGYNSGNGGSIVFDGTNDYAISTQNFIFSSNNPLTISVWIKTNSLTLDGAYYRRILSFNTNYGISTTTTSVGWYTAGVDLITPVTISTGLWYKVDCIYTGTQYQTYLNGVLANSFTSTFPATSSQLWIGRFHSSNDGRFNGNIAQASIYNRALSAAEIQQNFNATRSRFGI
jgi:hypothetical protein